MNDEQVIAKTILEAFDLHEASYQDTNSIALGFSSSFSKRMEECLIEAGDKNRLSKNLWSLLSFAMHWPNDVQAWAKDILAKKDISRNP